MKDKPGVIRPDEIQKALEAYDYRVGRQKGSHIHYINSKGDVITITKRNPIKAV